MKTYNKVMKSLTALLLMTLFPMAAFASDWEMRIKAETASRASNSLSLGQKADATDWFDGKYDVFAYVEGNISAYFPHTEWGQETGKYWRDIRGTGENKSWTILVESSLTGETITISWDKRKVPSGYSAILTDNITSDKIDMTAAKSYAYTHTGTRGFTVETVASQPVVPAETTPPVEQVPSVTHYAISGKVANSRKKGVSGVTVVISTDPVTKVTTDSDGSYTFTGIASGSYTVTLSMGVKDRFSPTKKDITVDSKDVANVNFTLRGKR